MSAALIGSLTGAYRWATRAGLAAVGTEHVLYEHASRPSAAARKAIAPAALAEVCRLVESGTFQSGRSGPAAEARSFPVDSVLREARWEAVRSLPRHLVKEIVQLPRWTAGLRSGVGQALTTARDHGALHPHGDHVLLGILADPDSGASRLLSTAGQRRSATITALSADNLLGLDGKAWLPAVEMLQVTGVVTDGPLVSRSPATTRLLTRVMGRMASGVRRAGGHGSPVAACLQTESVRQAVLLGDAAVEPRHVLLAVLALDDQLTQAARSLPARIARENTAAALLAEHGLAYAQAVPAAGQLVVQATGTVTEAPGLIFAPDGPEAPGWTESGAAIWARARAHAGQSGHKSTGTSHVLLALLDDPAGEADRLLRACEVDPAVVREHALACLTATPSA